MPFSRNDERIARWNVRFSRNEDVHEFMPSAPLPRAVEGESPGTALDVACGAGRHAIFLAERRWRVVAVDAAHVGVDIMLREAERRGVADRIEPHVADLEAQPPGFRIQPNSYDLIADFYYLHRPLFPAIRDGLRPGGLFVAAIHVASSPDQTQNG